jgi:hypothetical protein
VGGMLCFFVRYPLFYEVNFINMIYSIRSVHLDDMRVL